MTLLRLRLTATSDDYAGSGAQGCPTVYESQVILSIKDTPLVAKLRITSVCRNGSPQHDRVFDRTAVITRSTPDLPEPERRDFHLYVDEFHNFTTEAFTSILAEARKYRLCLTLCHQHSSQLPQETLDAVLGNVGSIVSFRVGDHDARLLEREFEGTYPSKVFSSLPNRHVVVKMLRDGEPLQPFQGMPESPASRRYGRRDILIARSRQKYAVPKDVVEDKIRRWMEQRHI